MIAMAERPKSISSQSELALGLPGMLSHRLFPGRISITVMEVAKAVDCDHKHVLDLIKEGVLGAIEITGRGNLSSREKWKIPVDSWDDFIRRRSNTGEGKR
jgi:hypothetical protein